MKMDSLPQGQSLIYEKVKEAGKHGLVFGLGGMINRAVGFFLIPLYTRLLTPSDYGTMELVNVLLAFVLPWFSCGLNIAIFRFYYEVKSDDDCRQLIGTTFTSILSISAVLTTILIYFRGDISRLFFGEARYSEYLFWAFTAGFFNANNSVPWALFRAQKKSGRYTLYNVITFGIGVSLNILFLVRFRWGVLGIFRARAVSAVVSCLLLLIDRRKDISIRFSFADFNRLFKFGMPFVPESVLCLVLTMSDRYIIKYFMNLSDLGLYSLGFKFASIVSLLFYGPIALIQGPIIFEVMNKPKAKKLYSKLLTYFFEGGIVLSLCLSLFSPEVLKVMATPAFFGAASIIPLICLGYIFYGCRVMAGVGLDIELKTYYFPIVVGIAAACNIAMNFALIPLMGIMGAALATALANGIEPALRYVFAQRYYKVQFEWSKLAGTFVMAGIIILVARWIEIDNLLISVLWKVFLLIAFLLVVNLSGIIDSTERKACLRILSELKSKAISNSLRIWRKEK